MNPHVTPANRGIGGASGVAFETGQLLFDRFVVLGAAARTGPAETWAVTDVTSQQRCEMEIYPAVPLNVPAWTDSLRRSATAASQLQHPNITRLLDLRVTPQFTAAIWQTGAGSRPLADDIAAQPERRLPFVVAAPWLEQLAGALDFIHANQAAHGALNLARLSIGPDGQLRLGHSCVVNALREIVLQCGQPWDAQDELPMLSPQRWDGAMVSAADDAYAFGAIAYWMLTGFPPFHQGDLAQQARSQPVTPIFLRTTPAGTQVQDVPPAWQAFINSCLAKHPAQRPPVLLPALRAAQPAPVAYSLPTAFPPAGAPPPPVPPVPTYAAPVPPPPPLAPAPVSYAPPPAPPAYAPPPPAPQPTPVAYTPPPPPAPVAPVAPVATYTPPPAPPAPPPAPVAVTPPPPPVAPPPAPAPIVAPPIAPVPEMPRASAAPAPVEPPPPPPPPAPTPPVSVAPAVAAMPPAPTPAPAPVVPPPQPVQAIAAPPPPPAPAPMPVTSPPAPALTSAPVVRDEPEAIEDAPAVAPAPEPKPVQKEKKSQKPLPAEPVPAAAKPEKAKESFDPYSHKHQKKGGNKSLMIFAAVAVVAAIGAGGYFWWDGQQQAKLRAEVAAKVEQAKARAEANDETGAIALLKDAQKLAPADAEIPAEITRIEQRALTRRFSAYLAELKDKGELARPAEAEALITQTLQADPANESARALRLAIEVAQRQREAAQKAAEEKRQAEQARIARIKEQESAAAKAEAEATRKSLQVAQLKLQIMQADSADKAPEATKALDELRSIAPTDLEIPALTARIAALTKPKEPPPEAKPAPAAAQTAAPQPDRRTPAQLISSAAPDYPADMLRSRTRGKVELSFVVEADGTVGDVQVVSSTRKSFSDAAIAAVKKYRFKPATLNGKPVPSRVTVPMEFNP